MSQNNLNIGSVRNCFGCGICAIACNQHIIDIICNADGFFEPRITAPEKCTKCGLCIDVCAYHHDDIASQRKIVHAYGAWSKDNMVRHNSTSGGVSYEIGKHLLGKGYRVCGVRFNVESNRAEHFIASNENELRQSCGSKYIQSYTLKALNKLDKREKYLIIGTPCMIDSMRRYIRKFRIEDNIILMDFYCHGVPSRWVWDIYLNQVHNDVGSLEHVAWRNKSQGWHKSYNMQLKGSKGIRNSNLYDGDLFYKLFFSDACLGKACYNHCRFRYDKSSADIRIGDAWGDQYQTNNDGVNIVVTFTAKGDELLKTSHCELELQSFEVIARGQMKVNPKWHGWYDEVRRQLNAKKTLTDIYATIQRHQFIDRWQKRCENIGDILRQSIKKIWR